MENSIPSPLPTASIKNILNSAYICANSKKKINSNTENYWQDFGGHKPTFKKCNSTPVIVMEGKMIVTNQKLQD